MRISNKKSFKSEIDMQIVVIGSTGMLGQALKREAGSRGWNVSGIARKNADVCCDICDDVNLKSKIFSLLPDVVVNVAAITSVDYCQESPAEAYMVNARSVGVMSDVCRQIGARFVHVSTDHYYINDGKKIHKEDEPVHILNEYARTKYLGECMALLEPSNLILRTNIVGFRGWQDKPTFLEWALGSLEKEQEITVIVDFFTSSIDVHTFSECLCDLLVTDTNAKGILNLASGEVSSKAKFITSLALACGMKITNQVKTGTIKDVLGIPRADTLGLDVEKVEGILGRKMPDLQHVLSKLAQEYRERKGAI